MLTPQEIKDKQFTKAVFGGYDMSSVDDFLEEVEESFAKLQKENSILKSKMKLLVEKIEEYRTAEDSMRMTLVAAKKTADEMLAESKKNSETMLAEAEQKSRSMIAAAEKKSGDIVAVAEAEAAEKMKDINARVYAEDAKLQEAKKRTEAYAAAISKLLNENAELIKNIDNINAQVPPALERPQEPVEAKKPVKEEPAPVYEEKAEPIPETKPLSFEDSVFESAEKSIEENETAPAVTEDLGDTKLFKLDSKDVWDDVDEPTSPHPKFDFSDLRFGTNYFGDLDDEK